MSVTKENVHDGKMLKELVSDVFKGNIKKVLSVITYDSKDNFGYLDKLKITPVIKVRKSSSFESNLNCMPRKLYIAELFSDVKRWKKRQRYGYKGMSESVFSSLKRMFDEYISSVKYNNIVIELMLKASIYNMILGNTTDYMNWNSHSYFNSK